VTKKQAKHFGQLDDIRATTADIRLKTGIERVFVNFFSLAAVWK